MSEHRVDIVAMDLAGRQAHLSVPEAHLAEQLVRAYAGGAARAAQHRRDEIKAKAKAKPGSAHG